MIVRLILQVVFLIIIYLSSVSFDFFTYWSHSPLNVEIAPPLCSLLHCRFLTAIQHDSTLVHLRTPQGATPLHVAAMVLFELLSFMNAMTFMFMVVLFSCHPRMNSFRTKHMNAHTYTSCPQTLTGWPHDGGWGAAGAWGADELHDNLARDGAVVGPEARPQGSAEHAAG